MEKNEGKESWLVGPGPLPAHSDPEVSIDCFQSSEFVVGKQTNFNGPVTIVSCSNALRPENPAPEKRSNEEKIIIRDKVLSPSWTREVEKGKSQELGKEVRSAETRRLASKKWTKYCVPILATFALLLMVVVTVVLFAVESPEEESGSTNETLRVYSKKDWGGKPPRSTVDMKLPVPYAVVSHTVTTQCYRLQSCSFLIRNMQYYHMSLDFADIAYNFLVDSSGNVYEGRGWNKRNVNGGFVNGRNVDIALIGDYSEGIFPTGAILEGLRRLLDFGVQKGLLSSNYSLVAANATYATLSPGKNVYQAIKNWSHFDPDPKSHVKEYY